MSPPPASPLVRPLEEGFQAVLDAVLRGRSFATTANVAKLGPHLAELSRAYNAGLAGKKGQARVPLDARIAFSFARDVPKGAAAVRELVMAGALRPREDRPLRIVDLGAGLGAMSWGITRAIHAGQSIDRASDPERGAAFSQGVEALLIDDDAEVLAAATSIAREAEARWGRTPEIPIVKTRTETIRAGMRLPEADVVVLGQVLSELDLEAPAEERASKHAALLEDLLGRVVLPEGSLVVVEPALRDRTRHLHAVRDVLAARGVSIFAPCLHSSACPMLAGPGDWCSEDLPVDLPSWAVPLARSAGLRFQGLTFSYLVLRRDAQRVIDGLETSPPAQERPKVHLRVVSELIRTKGKAELFACTAAGSRVRLRRLDRDAASSDEARATSSTWENLARGDVVTLRAGAAVASDGSSESTESSPIDERGRVLPTAAVDVWRAGK